MTDREDRQDITDVLLRYATGIDRRDWALFRTVFTEDCVMEYGEIGTWNGVDAVAEFMEQSHGMAGHTLHRLSNVTITVTGDSATARTYVDALILAPNNTSGVNAVGFYDDDLVRTDAGWRVRHRRFTAVRMGTVGGA
ncbi:polyketide cyclase [Mycobacterium sp. 852013-51886_SCH5428379]|uniref:nuclear transport factor 2 family protein n=1 Tax=Mycobacterium sp. 852013-51886_SCH5428379 TaxID=1834111 RepID=UPI0007FD1C0C|nr:nuclear transport factor 2 family protein [Mycobacterium sp. 852013-51886_SCH5428379]OBB60534.1 polyketide cyclase [Mycobacterium sp. 852013-51886_SCH5428379]